MFDRISADVDDVEVVIVFEAGDFSECVVRDMQLFQTREVAQASYRRETIGLDREYS